MKRTIIVDDIDGPVNQAETVPFSLDGIAYKVDLNKEHHAEIREALSRFITAGRRVNGNRTRKSRAKIIDLKPTLTTAGRIDQEQAAAVRRWARANGHQCSNKGRIPGHILQDYQQKAHPATREQHSTEEAVTLNGEAVVD